MEISPKTISLLRGLFAIDAEGKISLRVVATSPTGITNAVSSQSSKSLETLIASSVVLDTQGNPALRLAAVEFGTTVQERDRASDVAGQVEVAAQAAYREDARIKADLAHAEKPVKHYRPPGTIE